MFDTNCHIHEVNTVSTIHDGPFKAKPVLKFGFEQVLIACITCWISRDPDANNVVNVPFHKEHGLGKSTKDINLMDAKE